MERAFFVVQAIVLIFIIAHDWVPLGPLNDVATLKTSPRVRGMKIRTATNSLLVAAALILSILWWSEPYPLAVRIAFVAIYALLFAAEIVAWWVPYFFGASPRRTKAIQSMFARTHSLLPRRPDRIVPNTAHLMLHAMMLAALLLSVAVAVSA